MMLTAMVEFAVNKQVEPTVPLTMIQPPQHRLSRLCFSSRRARARARAMLLLHMISLLALFHSTVAFASASTSGKPLPANKAHTININTVDVERRLIRGGRGRGRDRATPTNKGRRLQKKNNADKKNRTGNRGGDSDEAFAVPVAGSSGTIHSLFVASPEQDVDVDVYQYGYDYGREDAHAAVVVVDINVVRFNDKEDNNDIIVRDEPTPTIAILLDQQQQPPEPFYLLDPGMVNTGDSHEFMWNNEEEQAMMSDPDPMSDTDPDPDPIISAILDFNAETKTTSRAGAGGGAEVLLSPEEDPLLTAVVVDEINLLGDITGDIGVVALSSSQTQTQTEASDSDSDLNSDPGELVEQEESQAEQQEPMIKIEYNTDLFEFINPSAIRPGHTTCGFLQAPLGYIPGEEGFPSIQTYFCVRFANNVQPVYVNAPWLAVHCGGPGTLSDCSAKMEGSYLSSTMMDTYNVISFDQRGMGRSWPSFAHDECTFGVTRRSDGVHLQEEEALSLSGLFIDSVNVQNSTEVQQYLEQAKDRVFRCWSCDTCDFHFQSTYSSSSITAEAEQYHFLDYSGTQEVVQDLELFRRAFDIPKLSLLGVSYGTQVFSVYASMFPARVDKLVLDANMSPNPDWLHLATSYARGIDARLDYLNFTCDTKNAREAGSCPVPSLAKCFQEVTTLIEDARDKGNKQQDSMIIYEYHQALASHLLFMSYDNVDHGKYLKQLCQAGEDANIWHLHSVLQHYADALTSPGPPPPPLPANEQEEGGQGERPIPIILQADQDQHQGPCESCPTSRFDVVGNPDYSAIMGNSMYNTVAIAETMVLAQSLSGGSHDMTAFMSQLQHIEQLYPGLGTHEPAKRFLYVYAMGYAWPEPHPIAPASNYVQKGIVSGQMYDPNTPYTWTQEMKSSFPGMTLLTSQWMEHGLSQHDTSNHYEHDDTGGDGTSNSSTNYNVTTNSNRNCFRHITKYLETGEIGIVDGTVCRTGYHNFHDEEKNGDTIPLLVSDGGTRRLHLYGWA
jgi:pimeloyl-ACP methyl ester carboxylesterase